jgi:hypothetical protein
VNCRRESGWRRLLGFFRQSRKRCGDLFLDESPPDSFVREPRRPLPSSSSGSVALELPPDLL